MMVERGDAYLRYGISDDITTNSRGGDVSFLTSSFRSRDNGVLLV